ncbi:SET domain-containing protein [Myriangium duriaei CBS 260.36]|uniref:SET domain-containing protein n=1 Tax=Myriangium duriaei CBS 260.36 TaxID=1168546 RepID=A0A9P4J5S7_9PEZI|nr:SET domain-containing protein [Myriangium duriaei CBS 260.36]
MATPERLTRSASRSSSTSTIMSNIDVAMSESGSSVAEHLSPLPTPATSVTDGSAGDAASEKPETSTISRDVSAQPDVSTARRSVRSRSSIESYNLAKLSGLKHGKRIPKVKESRSFSGDTLVNDLSLDTTESPQQRRRVLEGQVEKALQMDWQVGDLASDVRPASTPAASIKRRKSVSLEKLTKAAGKLSSALGKRSRESLSSKSGARESSSTRQSLPRQSSRKSDIVVKVQDVEDEQELERIERPTKKPRLLDTIVEITSSLGWRAPVKKGTKTWLTQGLYCGQQEDAKATVSDSRKSDVLATSHSAPGLSRRYLPLPMFSAATRESDFHLTYDLFAPLRRKENPKEWKKLSRNSFTPSAKEVWRSKKMDRSMCLCRPPAPHSPEEGCDENCINRHMLYECDENNCALGPELCTNRAFADLAKRTKKGNEFDIGVEIIKTPECGYGLRANRSFAPGQIIIEYCGEVISQEESDRRMNEVYKDNNAYYLMEFDQGMIIDATKGNIARFVNHSCQPNCKMEKRIVKGEPKMALFAGRNGVKTGEELSYDYNFDNFSALNVLDCRCGAELCRGKLERRDAKKEKETLAASLKRKLLEATTGVPEPPPEKVVLKKRKTGRWTKGWSYVDPEMEALRLKEDALENGRAIDGRALEILKEQAIKEDEKADASATGSKGGRSSRAAGLAAKAKLVERASSVRSVLSRKKVDPDEVQEKKGRRKSVLGRAAGALKSAAGVSPKVEDESPPAATEKRFSFEVTKPLLPAEAEPATKKKTRSVKSLRQSTLGFQPASEEKPKLPVLPAALHEDEDVLEMVLGYGGAARGGA